ncbi:MAG: hypothetical protein ABIO29_03400 [Sphingomicrobium sp.]
MVIRRIRDHVADHDWFAVAVDVGIVVLGVFLGTQVSNWNEDRVEREQARDYRARLIEEVAFNARQFTAQRLYYEQAKTYGREALSVLAGERELPDTDFVVAAYQLSQTDTTPAKTYLFDEMTANDMVTRLGDAKLQQATSDYYLGLNASNRVIAETYPYRTLIREVIPYDVQKQIRDSCGDREVRLSGRLVGVRLVVPCPVRLDPAIAARAAGIVRATPRIEVEMTRYIASLDEKLDQLGPGVDYSGTLRRALSAAGTTSAS